MYFNNYMTRLAKGAVPDILDNVTPLSDEQIAAAAFKMGKFSTFFFF